MATIDYIFNEGQTLEEIQSYVDSTYSLHYSQNKYQATEFIVDSGHGIGFTVGNMMKYTQRYGHKGGPDDWRADLMKVIHYAIIAISVHDSIYDGQEIGEPEDDNVRDKIEHTLSDDAGTHIANSSDDTIKVNQG